MAQKVFKKTGKSVVVKKALGPSRKGKTGKAVKAAPVAVPDVPPARLTTGELVRRTGYTNQTIWNKRQKGMSDAAILEECEYRRKMRELGMPSTYDKGLNIAGKRRVVEGGPLEDIGRGPVAGNSPVDTGNGGGGDPPKGPGVAADGGETMQMAQLRNARALADKNELEVKLKREELVEVEVVNSFFGSIVIKARDIITAIPDIVDRVRQAPTDLEARKMVDDECNRALAELEKYGEMMAREKE